MDKAEQLLICLQFALTWQRPALQCCGPGGLGQSFTPSGARTPKGHGQPTPSVTRLAPGTPPPWPDPAPTAPLLQLGLFAN